MIHFTTLAGLIFTPHTWCIAEANRRSILRAITASMKGFKLRWVPYTPTIYVYILSKILCNSYTLGSSLHNIYQYTIICTDPHRSWSYHINMDAGLRTILESDSGRLLPHHIDMLATLPAACLAEIVTNTNMQRRIAEAEGLQTIMRRNDTTSAWRFCSPTQIATLPRRVSFRTILFARLPAGRGWFTICSVHSPDRPYTIYVSLIDEVSRVLTFQPSAAETPISKRHLARVLAVLLICHNDIDKTARMPDTIDTWATATEFGLRAEKVMSIALELVCNAAGSANLHSKHMCMVCYSPAALRCRKDATWYCGKECQRADWKQHKRECV